MIQGELLQMAKIWQHEIKKMNMETCRGYISLFYQELPASVTVGELAREINGFYIMPTPFGKKRMNELADRLLHELERSVRKEEGKQPTATMQGA